MGSENRTFFRIITLKLLLLQGLFDSHSAFHLISILNSSPNLSGHIYRIYNVIQTEPKTV